MVERLTVQFARGARHKDGYQAGPPDRNNAPRPRRTIYRMQISGLPGETSWQVSYTHSFQVSGHFGHDVY